MLLIKRILALIIFIGPIHYLYADEVRIGATVSLTGPYANYGKQALSGIQLAVEEFNSQGGIKGVPVKLIVEDVGTLDLKLASSAAKKLIEVDRVAVLLPMIVEDSEVIVPLTSKQPMFTMATGCGSRNCSSSLGEYHVRAPASHDLIVEQLVRVSEKLGHKHSCVIASESTYFEAYGKYIEELLKKFGQQVTYVAVPLSNSDDYRSIATKFKHQGCEGIFTWIPMGAVGTFFRRIKESGSNAQVFSIVETDDPVVLQAAGDAAEGVIFARFTTGSEAFQKRFEERFGMKVSRPAIPSYDGVKLLLDLIKEVGVDASKLKNAFVEVKQRAATNGVLTYTSDGEREGEDVELQIIESGQAKPYQ